MKQEFYEGLKRDFVEVRFLHSKGNFDVFRLHTALENLRAARAQIEEKSPKKEKQLLLYCIDTLFEIIEENNSQKIYDFADIVHIIPDIFKGSCSIYSLRKEIGAFRKTYGDGYFADIYKIYPRFGGTPPQNAKSFFDSHSDDEFKAAHPVAYGVLITAGIIVLLAPMVAYILLMGLGGAPNNGWTVLGTVGCFIIGIGLFNVVAAFLHQYLGHIVTVGCLVVGGGLTVLSVWLVYKEMFVDFFAQPHVSAYMTVLFFLLVLAGVYAWFRHGVHLWLCRTRIADESRIKELKKGKANYWWYRQLHQTADMGFVYWLNKIYTVWYAAVLLLAVTTGFLRPMATVVCGLSLPLWIASAGMVFFTQLEDHRSEFGKPIVFFARSQGRARRIESIFFDLFVVVVVLALGYTHIRIVAELWDIALPTATEMFLP